MGVSLGKDYCIAGAELHRCPGVHFHEAAALGDEMKDDDALGTGLEELRHSGVGTWRLVTPGRREAGVDEDGAHQAHDA
jgi:hypothetical protein